MKKPQDRYIQVGKIKTRYWAEGERGTPVILIHGIGSYVEYWPSSFAALSAEHRVYAMDLPGQGRTDKPLDIPYQVKDTAQFVRDFMAALKIERASVVGHSLGGKIGMQFALMFPQALDKLVLVSSGGLGKEIAPSLRLFSVPGLGKFLTTPSLAGLEQYFKGLAYDPAVVTKEFVELSYQMSSLPDAQKTFLKILRNNFSLFGQIARATTGELAAIKSPTLVIWGRQDQMVPVSHADIAMKSFPDVRVEVIENCGHMPMFEHTQDFNNLLVNFLK